MTASCPKKTSKPANAQNVIALQDATLSFAGGQGRVDILTNICLSVPKGQTVAVLGPSGAGKTSLLMLMSGLEQLTSGTAMLAGYDITTMDEDSLAALRRDNVGIIFQAFRLIPSMTALQNVSVPLELAGQDDATEQAENALRSVGLGHRLTHLPDELSGGEQQRVAIARAIAPRPAILLADEPTGNLDTATGQLVIDQLFMAAKQVTASLILITHDEALARKCSRILRIEDGKIKQDKIINSPNAKAAQ